MREAAVLILTKGGWSATGSCLLRLCGVFAGTFFLVGLCTGSGLLPYKKGVDVLQLAIMGALGSSPFFLLFDRRMLRMRIMHLFAGWQYGTERSRSFALIAICAGLGLVLTSLFGGFAPQAVKRPYFEATASVWTGLFMGLGLFVPFAEEMFFRGFVWDRLSAQMPPRKTAVISALLFLSAHMFSGLVVSMMLIPMTAVITAIRLRSSGLGGCVVAHALYNTAYFLGIFIQVKLPMSA